MSEITEVIYEDNGGAIKTIFIGHGDIGISSIFQKDDSLSGIAFSSIEPVEIGEELTETIGKPINGKNVLIQILTHKKESLIVLKNAVEAAIKNLELKD